MTNQQIGFCLHQTFPLLVESSVCERGSSVVTDRSRLSVSTPHTCSFLFFGFTFPSPPHVSLSSSSLFVSTRLPSCHQLLRLFMPYSSFRQRRDFHSYIFLVHIHSLLTSRFRSLTRFNSYSTNARQLQDMNHERRRRGDEIESVCMCYERRNVCMESSLLHWKQYFPSSPAELRFPFSTRSHRKLLSCLFLSIVLFYNFLPAGTRR